MAVVEVDVIRCEGYRYRRSTITKAAAFSKHINAVSTISLTVGIRIFGIAIIMVSPGIFVGYVRCLELRFAAGWVSSLTTELYATMSTEYNGSTPVL